MDPETPVGKSRFGRGAGLSAAAALVRRHDLDRFQTALFAPAERREALFALYAFNYEIARIREVVSEPMLGQIRLQWWREVIDAAYAGMPPRRHETVLSLTAAIREFGLDRDEFGRLIDTRERDLDAEPPPNMAALEAYAEGTSAALMRLAVAVLGVRSPAALAVATEAGIGYALAGLLRAMPFHARAGRSYIPADLAGRVGLGPADYAARRGTPAVCAAVREIAAAAARRLAAARGQRAAVLPGARAAVLPVLVAERYLLRLHRARCDPFAPRLAAPDPLQPWRLLTWAVLGRY